MAFSATGFAFATALTSDMEDQDRARQIRLLGGLLGQSMGGIALIAAVANQDRNGGTVVTPAPAPPRPRRVQVPDLPDDPDDAKKVLTAHGLKAEVQTVVSDEPKGVVIGSDPPAETVVAVGTTVRVDVSAGVPVPNVVGLERDDAEAAVGAAGFDVVTRNADKDGKDNTVDRQEPAGGTFENVETTTVTLYVIGRKGKRRLAAARAGDGHNKAGVAD